MITQPGAYTAQFGRWLTQTLRTSMQQPGYALFYDHGDPQVERNVGAIKAVYGNELSRRTQLAHVDLLVARPNRDIVLLVEIEETGVSPKKIVGDLVTLQMCNACYVSMAGVNQRYVITTDTKLVIAGVMADDGSKYEQAKLIRARLGQFSAPQDSIAFQHVSYVFQASIQQVIEQLKQLVPGLIE